jgi:hypothetical protein
MEVELAFLDAVLHLAAGAVEILVELPRLDLAPRQRGDDEARISFAAGPFGLGDDVASAAPVVPRDPAEALEAARRSTSALDRGAFGRSELGLDLGHQAGVRGSPNR